MIRTTIIICILFCTLIVNAEDLVLNKESTDYNLGGLVEYYEDPTNELELNDIISGKYNEQFQTSPQRLHFGKTSSTYWLKFSVANVSKVSQWILEIDNPNIDYATLYSEQPNGKYLANISGARLPFLERGSDSRNLTFILTPGKEPLTYYLSLRSEFPLNVPLAIYGSGKYQEKENRIMIFFLIYLAITLLIIVINLFYYFYLKDIIYLLYCGVAVTIISGVSMISGYSFKYLWPQAPNFNLYASSIILFLSVYFVNGLVRKLLLANIHAPKWDKIAYYTQIAVLLLSLLSIFQVLDVQILNDISILSNNISIITVTFIGIQALRAKYKPAICYFIGFIGLASGSSVFILGSMYNVMENPLDFFVICIGSTWEMLFFMGAMAIRLKIQQKEELIKQSADYETKISMLEAKTNDTIFPPRPEHIQPLSPREKDVLKLISKGMTDQEIANHLFVSKSTVKTHTRKIYEKLMVSNRTEAALMAKNYGLTT